MAKAKAGMNGVPVNMMTMYAEEFDPSEYESEIVDLNIVGIGPGSNQVPCLSGVLKAIEERMTKDLKNPGQKRASKVYVFERPEGDIGVWGCWSLDQKLPGLVGKRLRIEFLDQVQSDSGPVNTYKIHVAKAVVDSTK